MKTPVGLSETEKAGPLVAQGSGEGAIISANSLDQGIKDVFHDKEEEIEDENADEVTPNDKVKYGDIVLHPLLFQDDVMNASSTLNSAQLVNDKLEKLLEEKLLDFNLTKSGFLITGSQKARKKLKREVDHQPLMLCKSRMSQESELRYLGMQLAATCAESVSATVNRRLGIANHAIYEISAVIRDSRASALGAVTTAMSIWEMSVIPMLLFSCEIWCPVPKKCMKKLDELSQKFL